MVGGGEDPVKERRNEREFPTRDHGVGASWDLTLYFHFPVLRQG